MKKILGLALLAGAATAATAVPASAEVSYSGNVALTSNYVFRGVSQSDNGPAVQGGFDVSSGIFYAGTWASSVDFGWDSGTGFDDGGVELDLYAGLKPTLGPVAFDIGVLGYFYPGSEDGSVGPEGVDLDYYELKFAPSITPVEGLTLGAAVYYSPEFTGSTDSGLYYEANAAFTISDMFSVSGAVGKQTVDQVGYFVLDDGTATDEYTTWNVGGTMSVAGFGLDLRYVNADESITNGAGNEVSKETVVFTIKRAL
ncbi:MAG: TorF family putative porin [Caulobacterales bacterium]